MFFLIRVLDYPLVTLPLNVMSVMKVPQRGNLQPNSFGYMLTVFSSQSETLQQHSAQTKDMQQKID